MDEFNDDIQLMVNNCAVYWGAEDMYSQVGFQLRDAWNYINNLIQANNNNNNNNNNKEATISSTDGSISNDHQVDINNNKLDSASQINITSLSVDDKYLSIGLTGSHVHDGSPIIIDEILLFDDIINQMKTVFDSNDTRAILSRLLSISWDYISKLDKTAYFAVPVSDKNYAKVISNPFDLDSIKITIFRKKYKKFEDFSNEISTMFQNCFRYNKEDSAIFKDAERIRFAWSLSEKNIIAVLLRDSSLAVTMDSVKTNNSHNDNNRTVISHDEVIESEQMMVQQSDGNMMEQLVCTSLQHGNDGSMSENMVIPTIESDANDVISVIYDNNNNNNNYNNNDNNEIKMYVTSKMDEMNEMDVVHTNPSEEERHREETVKSMISNNIIIDDVRVGSDGMEVEESNNHDIGTNNTSNYDNAVDDVDEQQVMKINTPPPPLQLSFQKDQNDNNSQLNNNNNNNNNKVHNSAAEGGLSDSFDTSLVTMKPPLVTQDASPLTIIKPSDPLILDKSKSSLSSKPTILQRQTSNSSSHTSNNSSLKPILPSEALISLRKAASIIRNQTNNNHNNNKSNLNFLPQPTLSLHMELPEVITEKRVLWIVALLCDSSIQQLLLKSLSIRINQLINNIINPPSNSMIVSIYPAHDMMIRSTLQLCQLPYVRSLHIPATNETIIHQKIPLLMLIIAISRMDSEEQCDDIFIQMKEYHNSE
eukprot:gene16661-22777_t